MRRVALEEPPFSSSSTKNFYLEAAAALFDADGRLPMVVAGRRAGTSCRDGTDGNSRTGSFSDFVFGFSLFSAWEVSDEFYGWQRGFGLVVDCGWQHGFLISRSFFYRAR